MSLFPFSKSDSKFCFTGGYGYIRAEAIALALTRPDIRSFQRIKVSSLSSYFTTKKKNPRYIPKGLKSFAMSQSQSEAIRRDHSFFRGKEKHRMNFQMLPNSPLYIMISGRYLYTYLP